MDQEADEHLSKRRRRPRRRRARIDPDLPFEFDTDAQQFVSDHPHGATLAEISAEFGLTRERIRQIEANALRKLHVACRQVGMTVRQILGRDV